MSLETCCASCSKKIERADLYVMMWPSWLDFPDYLCDPCWVVMSSAALTYLRGLDVGVPEPEST